MRKPPAGWTRNLARIEQVLHQVGETILVVFIDDGQHLFQRAAYSGVGRPAGAFPDVDEAQRSGSVLRLGGYLGEQRGFLGAGDNHRLIGAEAILEGAEFTSAKLREGLGGAGAAEAAGNAVGVNLHRAFAVADQQLGGQLLVGLGLIIHRR